MKGLISVIIPVYKAENDLRRCVESLQAQTYENLEIILVDDGSPDGCPALCDVFQEADPRIRVIHKANGGVSSARNAGLSKAGGMYVQFVDSDDFVEPDYCAAMADALEKTRGSLAVCGFHHHYVGADVEKVPQAGADLLELYGTGFLNMPWNKLYRKEYMGHFPEDLSLGEDLLFNLEYLRRAAGRGKEGGGASRTREGGQADLRPDTALVERPLYHYIQEESRQTLSNLMRADKLELARRIRRETGDFFREEACPGAKGGRLVSGPDGGYQEERIRRVVDTRFLCECLDDVERLPFDREMTAREKREAIRRLCLDADVREACSKGQPKPLDYRLLKWSLGHGMVWTTCLLNALRSVAVRLKRKI